MEEKKNISQQAVPPAEGAREHGGEYLVEVENLVKWFPIKSSFFRLTIGNVRAVDGISFKIRRGQTMGLVGESGCGKSTAGRTMLRLLEPTSGEVYFDGQPLSALSRQELRKLRPRADADSVPGPLLQPVAPPARGRDNRRGGARAQDSAPRGV